MNPVRGAVVDRSDLVAKLARGCMLASGNSVNAMPSLALQRQHIVIYCDVPYEQLRAACVLVGPS